MELHHDRIADAVSVRLEHEVALIRDAIALVASGGAPRVVVAGLKLGDALLPTARRMADQAGVRIVPLWRADEAGLDVAVERPRE
jgi:hypothetical protein